ncbi:MAG: mechanosensitive ion channel family protein [Candidatus Omnitrophica bacterium]|nr:mechanosensitive ion channel family protein [Candidatus Omnitrophota bacterium]
MILDYLSHLPDWAQQGIWSLIALLAIYLIGRFLARTVCRRLSAWAEKTAWKWDEVAVEMLRKGIPMWSLLFGLYIALDFWSLPEHVHKILNNVIYVLGWTSVTLLFADLAGRLTLLYSAQFQHALPVTSLTRNIASLLVLILGGLTILHGLGVSIVPLLTALGIGGLAVALALQDTLTNLFSGFYLTLARQIRVGDYIKLDSGQEGYVEDIGWRATQILLPPNNMVYVPNKKLGEAIITNYDRPTREMVVTIEVGVEYGSDLARVESVTIDVGREVMRQVAGGIPTFDPIIRFNAFGPSSINFTAVLRVKTFGDQYLIKHEFIKRLHVRYQQEGIVIPYPTQVVYSKSV